MRKLLLLLACVATHAYSQDVIVKKDGSTILSKVLEVSSTEIKYKKFSNLEGPTYTISVAELLSINYANGDKDDFSKVATPGAAPAQSEMDMQVTEEDKKANSNALKKLRDRMPASPYKASKSKAVLLYCLCKPTGESVLADANVELSFKTDISIAGQKDAFSISQGGKFIVTVRNKSKKTIYIDLANTFFVRGSQSEPYYIPTATSNTQGKSSSVGVNVGKITGIGGGLNGLNVGGGTSNYSTTVTYSQRVVAIPPMSSRDLAGMDFFPNESAANNYGSGVFMQSRSRYGTPVKYPHFTNSLSLPPTIGAVKDYQEGELPFQFNLYLSYSFSEDVAVTRSLNTNFYIREIIGIPEQKMMGIAMPMPKNPSPTMLDEAFVIMFQDN